MRTRTKTEYIQPPILQSQPIYHHPAPPVLQLIRLWIANMMKSRKYLWWMAHPAAPDSFEYSGTDGSRG